MKCVICNRPLTKAAVTVSTRTGARAWGPICARRAGLMDAIHRAVASKGTTTDPRQMDLLEGVE